MKSKVCKLKDTPLADGHAGDSITPPGTGEPYVIIHEAISTDDGAQNFVMRVIEQGPGKSSPGHAHVWEHEIFVLSGEGIAHIEKEEFKISKDSVIFFAPNEWHKISTPEDAKEPLRWITIIPVGSTL